MRFLVCGSRDYAKLEYVDAFIDSLQDNDEVIVGDARGVDRRVLDYLVANLDIQVRCFPADWKIHGNRGGLVRNLEMLDCMPHLIVVFWDGESRGSKFMIDTALKRHLNLRVIFDIP